MGQELAYILIITLFLFLNVLVVQKTRYEELISTVTCNFLWSIGQEAYGAHLGEGVISVKIDI